MTLPLFDLEPVEAHDAGGKVKTKLPAGVRGDAAFSGPNDCYRHQLRRWIGDAFPAGYTFFLGMNPSTAMGHINDSTIKREFSFARREGYNGYWKCNVMDYRATRPEDLLRPGIEPRSEINLQAIRDGAAEAGLVVICHGKLHKRLAAFGCEAVEALRRDGRKLWCFGQTSDGSPKHPLYLAAETPLIPFSAA